MAITIKGIRIASLTFNFKEDGKEKCQGEYELVSSEDKVLAKQSFNGYNGMEFKMAADTAKLLNEFHTMFKRDIQDTLGLQNT